MDITLILVTLVSLTLAAVMTTLAWRLAREQRRRSDARVSALAEQIHSARGPREDSESAPAARHDDRRGAIASGGGAPRAVIDDLPLQNAPTGPIIMNGDLFGAAQPAPAKSRFAAIVAVGVIVVGSAVATVLVLTKSMESGPGRTPQIAGAPAAAPAAAPAPAAPLELVALTHEREGDRLTVRGVVRNPASGAGVAHLTAVVFLFNRDGGFVASGRAGVDAPELAPGTEAPFAVTISGAGDVGRYRVSFRTDDRVVPHVDRRDCTMAQAR